MCIYIKMLLSRCSGVLVHGLWCLAVLKVVGVPHVTVAADAPVGMTSRLILKLKSSMICRFNKHAHR